MGYKKLRDISTSSLIDLSSSEMIIKLTLFYYLLIGYSYVGGLSRLRKAVKDLIYNTKNLSILIQATNDKPVKNVFNGKKDVFDELNESAFGVTKKLISGLTEVIGTPITTRDLTFHLVTKENLDNAIEINFNDPSHILWQKENKIYFLIHGWKGSKDSEWIQKATEILLTKQPDAQVIQVDWEKPAKELYSLAVFETENAGYLVGLFINTLIHYMNVPEKNIVIIGHSLGAQIAGWTGKKIKTLSFDFKLHRIIALDPAGPLFLLRPDSKKLNRDDAEVVMVIHTDGNKLGYESPCGTIDFFPNGGLNQPGCLQVDLGNLSTYTGPVTCDHSRAWQFFNEAIEVPGSFQSRACDSYESFQKDGCESYNLKEWVAMGDLETRKEGKFYLVTNSDPPYSIVAESFRNSCESRGTCEQ